MFKKNSWIVALFLALSLTTFFLGCVDPLVEDTDEGATYEEYPLDKGFNVWGGSKASQMGWATGGLVTNEGLVTKDLGYELEKFQTARYLVIEMSTDSPNGIDLIWGASEDDPSGISGWIQQNGVQNAQYSTKEGNILTIDLTKAVKDYGKFKTPSSIKIILQYNPSVEAFVKSAKLLIPEYKFVPATDITFKGAAGGFQYTPYTLDAAVTPGDATRQGVTWSIISFTPTGGGATLSVTGAAGSAAYNTSKAALLAKVSFQKIKRVVTPAASYTDYSVVPPETIKFPDTEVSVDWFSGDKIVVQEPGRVKVRATIQEGGDKEKDFTKDFDIVFTEKEMISFVVNGASQSTRDYDLYENGAKGGSFVKVNGGFSVVTKDSNGNTANYFKVDFGNDTFSQYEGIRFKLKGKDEDGKSSWPMPDGTGNVDGSLRVKAMTTFPTSGYAPGDFVYLGGTGDITNAKAFDVKFGLDERNNIGNVGGAANLNNVKDEKELYFWIYFQPNAKNIEFTVTDIEFYKKGGSGDPFVDAVGITTGIGAQGSATFSAGVIGMGKKQGGSTLFTLDLPSATSKTGTKNITITYICKEVSPVASLTLKNGGWGSIDGPESEWYPNLAVGSTATLVLPESWYADATSKISFQGNDYAAGVTADTEFYIKITKVEME